MRQMNQPGPCRRHRTLKIISVKDVKLGGTCGREAGEAAFGGDMVCVTSLSSETRFTCPVSRAALGH